jgi:ParB-like chromosome segregation protein Spo0J
MTAEAAPARTSALSEDGQHTSLNRWLTVSVPIANLSAADSPRLTGELEEHVQALAACTTELPPIVVHRRTMRVIDGMHRLQAARLRGETEIAVHFFDGDDNDVFPLAVQLNIAHGLPLSIADRTHAAARILDSHPHWSDRAIAELAKLAPSTVSAIRRCSTVQGAQSNTRVGRDGRVRPVDGEPGRQLVSELLKTNPDAPLREVAKAAGVAPSTAWRVRSAMRAGKPAAAPSQPTPRDRTATLRHLKQDPSLRFTESGRTLLRWLSTPAVELVNWPKVIADLPRHCGELIADLARQNAAAWQAMADRLDQDAG